MKTKSDTDKTRQKVKSELLILRRKSDRYLDLVKSYPDVETFSKIFSSITTQIRLLKSILKYTDLITTKNGVKNDKTSAKRIRI